MTEFGPGLFALAPEDAIRKARGINTPNFFVDARIVDRDNRSLGPNQVGELVLKGPSIATGFTSATLLPGQRLLIAMAGFIRAIWPVMTKTGAFISLTSSRTCSFLATYPAEIEAVLYRHPAVFSVRWSVSPIRNGARWGKPSWC